MAGRPTKYKPEYCEAVIKVGEEGGWLAEMAEECDVCRSTMDNWVAEHPEFLEALTRAKQKAQAWFEKAGRTGLIADKFNSSLWAKQMSARHPDEYSERKKFEHTGRDGGAINVRSASELTDDQLAAIAAASSD
jgi:transposase-like protein